MVQAVGGAGPLFQLNRDLTDLRPHQRGWPWDKPDRRRLGPVHWTARRRLLAAINWRAVFLVSVPFSVGGAIWAYLALHETAKIRQHQEPDIPGNFLFAVVLTAVLIGMTYGLEPYGSSSMGWGDPFVISCLAGGATLLVVFFFMEQRALEPMFRLELFKIRMFLAGNTAGFLASLARGGLTFMLIIWLQGIWLPLHGYNFKTRRYGRAFTCCRSLLDSS